MGLRKKCRKAIKIEIAKKFRFEANIILDLSSKNVRLEFLEYHKLDQGNICCLVLDKAKQSLVDDGIMVQKDKDGFGNFTY